MKPFEVFCRLSYDSDYCKAMIEKYGEENLNALSFLIANNGLGFNDSAPVIISRPGWEGGCSPDISEWCHLKGIEVKDFNHPVKIDPNATNLRYAFHGCESFNQEIDVPKNIYDREYMLKDCKSFDQPVGWFKDTGRGAGLLYGCSSFNQKLIFPNHVSGFGSVCKGCSSLNSIIRIPDNISMVTLLEMFAGCESLTLDKFLLSDSTCYG